MAKNDIVIIDSIIQERIYACLPSSDKGEVYEYLANEQILKNLDLSYDEIMSGMTDGKDDGGIDSFYIFVNGNLLNDVDDFMWPKRNADIEVYLITCKHHDSFTQPVVNDECATVAELFDFALTEKEIQSSYNEELLQKRNAFFTAYKKTASILEKLSFKFYYASRGDTESVGENIKARTERIKATMMDLFSECHVEYNFVGSSEILSMFRKKPQYDLEIPYTGIIAQQKQCSVLLCNLLDYYNFITDENGKLRTYLFDSNVRDYMGDNLVNQDIQASLMNPNQNIDFWWLNNGITFLATSAKDVGKILQVKDIQIVNGLQTSHSIFKYFSETQSTKDDRSVMIKIITQTDPAIRDSIIRSTNNQTAVEVSSLFATDKIQRDIEDVLKQNGFYYERRKNCYANNEDIDKTKIVNMMYLAAGYMCLILKSPKAAFSFKQKYFKVDQIYNTIFSPKDSLLIWPKISFILKKVDNVIQKLIQKDNSEKQLKGFRFLTAFLTISRLLKDYNFSAASLIKLDNNLITEDVITSTYYYLMQKVPTISKALIKNTRLQEIFDDASYIYGITGVWRSLSVSKLVNDSYAEKMTKLLDVIRKELPEQPWPQNIDEIIANKIGEKKSIVRQAISRLIKEGNWQYHDFDGVNQKVESILEMVKKELPAQPWPQNIDEIIAIKIGEKKFIVRLAILRLIKEGNWRYHDFDGINRKAESILEIVNKELPAQPWPQNIDEIVAQKLGEKKKIVRLAILKLIKEGNWQYHDFDGDNQKIESITEMVKTELPIQPWPNNIDEIIAKKIGEKQNYVRIAIMNLIKKGYYQHHDFSCNDSEVI